MGDVPDDITIRVNNDPVEKVKQFKYLGSLKSTDGDCSKDVNARIAMAKRRMCELTTLWKDRSIPVALKMRLVKTLVWTVLSYGAEAWTLKARDERKITSMEMWLWRRMLRISWMEKRTDNRILQELEIKRELLGHVRKRKLSYYGHLCRDHGCQITKTVVEGQDTLKEGEDAGGPENNTSTTSNSGQSAYGLQKIAAAGNSSSVKRWWPTIIRDLPKKRRRRWDGEPAQVFNLY